MEVYMVWCKYYKDWDWELLKLFNTESKAKEYLKNLDCFDSYIDSMIIE